MIVNQATQIANQIRQMRTMTRQLTELEEQLDYMKDAADRSCQACVLIGDHGSTPPRRGPGVARGATSSAATPQRPA